jgi:hypothetical protein
MAESLPIEPQTKAVLTDQIPVPGDGSEMGDGMHGQPPVAGKMLMQLLYQNPGGLAIHSFHDCKMRENRLR